MYQIFGCSFLRKDNALTYLTKPLHYLQWHSNKIHFHAVSSMLCTLQKIREKKYCPYEWIMNISMFLYLYYITWCHVLPIHFCHSNFHHFGIWKSHLLNSLQYKIRILLWIRIFSIHRTCVNFWCIPCVYTLI
jgi:hypothetical protein